MKKRSNKNPETEVSTGYNKLHTTQTSDPKIITGTRPTVSVNLPLKGLDIPAINVKSAMMSPLYSAPPSLVRYPGNSGIIMVKLAANKKLLAHNNANCKLK